MDDDNVRHRNKKSKHKDERKHKHKSDKRRHRDSDSDDEQQPPLPPQVQVQPWHCMQFELIDGVNRYGADGPDSRILRGLGLGDATEDMRNFTRLVSHLREAFMIHPELTIVLRVTVRASLKLRSLNRGPASRFSLMRPGLCLCVGGRAAAARLTISRRSMRISSAFNSQRLV
jgi:hypothetical protein